MELRTASRHSTAALALKQARSDRRDGYVPVVAQVEEVVPGSYVRTGKFATRTKIVVQWLSVGIGNGTRGPVMVAR